MNYFGAREIGPPIQDQQVLTLAAWHGIVAVVQAGLRTGLFAEDFPDRTCGDLPDAITGCCEEQFNLRLSGEHPDIRVPLDPNTLPETIPALELIEFCYPHVSMPIAAEPHEYFVHRHYLHFRRADGQAQFAREINTILSRNHLAYELQENGEVRRILPPVLGEVLAVSEFRTEDNDLNHLLETARRRFGDPDFHVRYDALRALWDAFERLKTLEPPHEIRRSVAALIARATQEPRLQTLVDRDMSELTRIGNEFFIRHANAGQVRLETSEEIDYLFHRLFAVIRFLLRGTQRGQ
jgi:archaeosine-15-forming tRNA-guanine transglycosylase